MEKLNNIKHVIWDWNGTLLNDVEFCNSIINKILTANSLPELTLEKYRNIFTFPVQKYYEAAGLDFSIKSFEVLGKEFMDDYEKNKLSCVLYENAKELLSEIHKNNIRQSVLSAYKHDTLIEILKHYKLSDYFDHVIGSDNIYAGGKTHLGLKLIEMLDESKDQILFVGDTLHDADVAEAMGVKCVLIADGHQEKSKLIQNGTLVLNNIKELSDYLFPLA